MPLELILTYNNTSIALIGVGVEVRMTSVIGLLH